MARTRIAKEKEVVGKMIAVYCRGSGHGGEHGRGALCPECAALMEYACKRLDHCRFGEEKTFCKHCPVHCYSREMKARIRTVMRYSGPRMMLYHPWTALGHLASSVVYKLSRK